MPAPTQSTTDETIHVTFRARGQALVADVPAAMLALLQADGTVRVVVFGSLDHLHLVASDVIRHLDHDRLLGGALRCALGDEPCATRERLFPGGR